MRKTGFEPITCNGRSTGFCLRDFWSWGYSDLLDNTLRGSYAEFIVASALGMDLSAPRINWEPWDLTLNCNGRDLHIEVKSASYLQTWDQTHPSAIQFSIRPTIRWSPAGGYSGEARRQSDVYVFCLFAEKDAAKADPLNLDGWDFYVLSTQTLNAHCGQQKTIRLQALLRLQPEKADFAGLKGAVLRNAH